MQIVLLVDENPLRASLRQSTLEKFLSGSRHVVRAADASEALCLVESPEFSDALCLAITSRLSSGVSALDFVTELRSRIPGLPVLMIGTADEADVLSSGSPDFSLGVRCIQSGSMDELRAEVRQMIVLSERQTA